MKLDRKVALILQELFNFDGQIEELCTMSEMEGQFGMSADEMLSALRTFVAVELAVDAAEMSVEV